MKSSKKQDYKKILFLGTFLTPTLIELMETEDGRESLYRLLKLYVEKKAKGGIIKDKYEIVIG